MQLKLENSFKEYIKEIEKFLDSRKNLMVYEDYKDSLLNEVCRFVYSSPKDFLEFIFVDIYNKQEDSSLYGIISINASNKKVEESLLTLYGTVKYEAIKVRNMEKTKISLILNANGYENLENAINYFEDSLI